MQTASHFTYIAEQWLAQIPFTRKETSLILALVIANSAAFVLSYHSGVKTYGQFTHLPFEQLISAPSFWIIALILSFTGYAALLMVKSFNK